VWGLCVPWSHHIESGSVDQESRERARLEAEEKVRLLVDSDGTRWTKVYFGGGEHLRNWLEQSREIAGEDNVRVEQIDPEGLPCFGEGPEGMFRIWVREGSMGSGQDG